MSELLGEKKWNLNKILDIGEIVVDEVIDKNMEKKKSNKDFVNKIV